MKILRLAAAACLAFGGAAPAQLTQLAVPIGPRGGKMTLQVYLFDSGEVKLKVIEQGAIEEQTYKNLEDAMRKHACLAGCSGEALDQATSPVAPAVAGEEQAGAADSGREDPAGVLIMDGNGLRIVRADEYALKGAGKPQRLLRWGPILVEKGKPVDGPASSGHERRTFLVTDGGSKWGIGVAPATTLDKLSAVLSDPELFTPFKVKTALNLAGGSSSAFWVKRVHHPYYLHELEGLKSFIGLVKR